VGEFVREEQSDSLALFDAELRFEDIADAVDLVGQFPVGHRVVVRDANDRRLLRMQLRGVVVKGPRILQWHVSVIRRPDIIPIGLFQAPDAAGNGSALDPVPCPGIAIWRATRPPRPAWTPSTVPRSAQ